MSVFQGGMTPITPPPAYKPDNMIIYSRIVVVRHCCDLPETLQFILRK